jgi:tripartite-type tricarboxylate transporter receptor subunit TctC
MLAMSRRAVMAGAVAVAASPASAQRLSDQPITIVIPFSPGSGPDLLARMVADEMRTRWGQVVIPDNKAGASGNIGAAAASRAAPDGRTLLLWVNTVLMNAALARNLPFEPVKGFEPIIELAQGTLALAVHNAVPFTDARALVAASIAKPTEIRYASPGRGTPHHLAMELFKLKSGAKLDHIPYNGTAGAVNDFIAGHVQAMFIPIHVGLSHAQNGLIRLLGVANGQRSPLAPNVPTLAEQGIAGVDVNLGYGVSAPAGTPVVIIERYNAALNEILGDTRVKELLEKQGLAAVGGSTRRFAERIDEELPRWRAVVQSAGITLDQ